MRRLTHWIGEGKYRRALPKPKLGVMGKERCINKLAEYEDLEERGLLVRLPCKVGDTVWVIYDNYVTSALVLAFYIDGCGGMFDLKIRTNRETATGCEQVINKDYSFVDFGKTVFLTPEEAEAALKKMGSGGE